MKLLSTGGCEGGKAFDIGNHWRRVGSGEFVCSCFADNRKEKVAFNRVCCFSGKDTRIRLTAHTLGSRDDLKLTQTSANKVRTEHR